MLKKLLNKKAKAQDETSVARRKFLSGAATTGAALAAFPMMAAAQEKKGDAKDAKAAPAAPAVVSSTGAQSMRWQSTWPAKDIFHEYALDFAKKVNDMTGGALRI